METDKIRNYFFLLALCSVILCFFGLEKNYVISGDESRVMGISAEMFLEHNYVVPKLNDRPFLEYPPLYYWAQTVSYSLFGMNAFAVKFPSALVSVCSVLLLFLFGLKLRLSPHTAFLSALIFLTSSGFLRNSHTGRVDSMLMFFILLAVSQYPFTDAKKKSGRMFFFAIGTAGALLTKGLIGPVLIAAISGGYFLIRDIPAKRFRFRSYLLYAACLAAGMIPALIWSLILIRHEGTEGIRILLLENVIGRITGSVDDHAEPFYYYLQRLPEIFLPWNIVLPFALWSAFRKVLKKRSRVLCFLLWALIVPFILLSICSNKRGVYLLPLAPFASLLCGIFFSRICAMIADSKSIRRIPDISALILASAAVVSSCFIGSELLIYPAAAVLLLLIVPFIRRNWEMKISFWLIGCSAFLAALLTIFFHWSGKSNDLRSMFDYVKEKEKEGFRVFLVSNVERTLGAAYYYMKRNIPSKKPSRTDIGKKEIWIIRGRPRRFAKRFSDGHAVVTPAEYFREKDKRRPSSRAK